MKYENTEDEKRQRALKRTLQKNPISGLNRTDGIDRNDNYTEVAKKMKTNNMKGAKTAPTPKTGAKIANKAKIKTEPGAKKSPKTTPTAPKTVKKPSPKMLKETSPKAATSAKGAETTTLIPENPLKKNDVITTTTPEGSPKSVLSEKKAPKQTVSFTQRIIKNPALQARSPSTSMSQPVMSTTPKTTKIYSSGSSKVHVEPPTYRESTPTSTPTSSDFGSSHSQSMSNFLEHHLDYVSSYLNSQHL